MKTRKNIIFGLLVCLSSIAITGYSQQKVIKYSEEALLVKKAFEYLNKIGDKDYVSNVMIPYLSQATIPETMRLYLENLIVYRYYYRDKINITDHTAKLIDNVEISSKKIVESAENTAKPSENASKSSDNKISKFLKETDWSNGRTIFGFLLGCLLTIPAFIGYKEEGWGCLGQSIGAIFFLFFLSFLFLDDLLKFINIDPTGVQLFYIGYFIPVILLIMYYFVRKIWDFFTNL